MKRYRVLTAAALAALAALATAGPLAAQTYDWQYRWYWGAKGGVLGYTLPNFGQVFAPQIGGEWMITGRRTALYVGYSTTTQAERDVYAVPGITGTHQVDFDNMGRLQLGVLVFPTSGRFQPYIGGGFVIETLGNARYSGTSPTPAITQAVQDASSGGFALIIGGAQLRLGRKMALFGHFQASPQGRAFLLPGGSSSIEAGLRYAFLPAREDDVTTRR